MNKYKNVKTTIDGIEFDSKREAERYSELKLLERAGVVSGLETQPAFTLIEPFEVRGVKQRKTEYIADFKYYDTDKKAIVVEDVKSPASRTALYMLKKKLFLKKFGDKYIFTEVY